MYVLGEEQKVFDQTFQECSTQCLNNQMQTFCHLLFVSSTHMTPHNLK